MKNDEARNIGGMGEKWKNAVSQKDMKKVWERDQKELGGRGRKNVSYK